MLRKWGLFALGWALILAGALLAHAIQTTGGIKVSEVRIAAAPNVTVAGLLYVPPGVDATHKAPAVLASHGYINTREMQSPFAIELARRGFVVLAMDMTGHGSSGGNVGAVDYGGPAALAWLQSQPMVDRGNIGLEGHSMGGAPVLSAAVAQPTGYRSMVLEGSTTGLFGPPKPGTPDYPRNLAVVFGQFDEFAGLMWQEPKGSQVAQSDRLRALFGIAFPVAPGKVYGDPAAWTARVFYNPPVTHPWEHFSRAGVGHAVDWFQRTLVGARSYLDPMDQIWIWKEVGTLIAFLGMVLMMLGAVPVLLAAPVFASLAQPAQPVGEARHGGWWLSLLLTAGIPAGSFFLFMKLGYALLPNPVFPEWVQNQLLVWALLNAVITLALGFVLRAGKPHFARADWPRMLGFSAAVIGLAYLSLVAVDAVFKVDFRFWVLGLKPLDARHAAMFVAYLVPWTGFFLVALRALHSALAVRGEGEGTQIAYAILAMAGGFAVLLAAQYGCLFATGLLLTPTEPLSNIIAIQFVPLLAVVGAVAVVTYRRTNSYIPGALICAALIAWYVTAGTATHWSADFPLNLPGAPRAK